MTAKLQSGRNPNAVFSRRRSWLFTFLGFTAFGLFSLEYRYLDDLARGNSGTFVRRLFEEMDGAYAGLLLFPVVLWAVRRMRIRRNNWWRTVPLNVLFLAAFSLCDTTVMAVSRSLLSPLFGLGRYDYGIMFYRYPMEAALHVPLYFTAVVVIYIVDAYREARDNQMASADLEARLAEAQLQNLRLQLQPHFLFNALNTISSVMYEDVGRADSMLAQLSELLRKTLHTADTQEIPLLEEVALVKSYLAIMEARFGDDLRVELEIDPDLLRMRVPQLILQPLVENSIRHGRNRETSQFDLHISVFRDHEDMLLRVRDSGPGIADIEQGLSNTGIGLRNTEQRLRNLYGPSQRMTLENSNGLAVSIRIPCRVEAAST